MKKASAPIRAIRIAGLLLLGYTLFMVFTVPLGPGLLDVQTTRQEVTEDGGVYELEIVGHNTHFDQATPLVFIRHGDVIRNATAIKGVEHDRLKCRVRLPKNVPSRSWDVFVNDSLDGTISYANGFFAEGLNAVSKAKLSSDDAVLSRLQEPHLTLPFPVSTEHHGEHPQPHASRPHVVHDVPAHGHLLCAKPSCFRAQRRHLG